MNTQLFLVGLSHKTAPIEVREAFALSDLELLSKGFFSDGGDISEYLILSTCNRVEILAISEQENTSDIICKRWAELLGKNESDLAPYTYSYKGKEVVEHFFSVASSLDSMILGEPQILGQIKNAFRFSLATGTAKMILSRLLHKTFSVAKRVRTETAIASNAVSISYAAIELAKKIFDNMAETKAMLIGAGEMAELSAHYLVNSGIHSFYVVNRTFSRAEEMANHFGGQAIHFDDIYNQLINVDIVISSTAANEPVIRADMVKEILRKRKNKPIFFIDIAVPRDIDPAVNEIDNIYLYDIDDLNSVVEKNLLQRKEEAIKAHRIINEESVVFLKWLESLELQSTIVDLIDRNKKIVKNELEKTLRKVDPFSDNQQKAIEVMLASIVKKINHDPITFLKRSAVNSCSSSETEELVFNPLCCFRKLFNLDDESQPRLTYEHKIGKSCRHAINQQHNILDK